MGGGGGGGGGGGDWTWVVSYLCMEIQVLQNRSCSVQGGIHIVQHRYYLQLCLLGKADRCRQHLQLCTSLLGMLKGKVQDGHIT